MDRATSGPDEEVDVKQKPLGVVIREVTDEMRSWPAWAQPYRPAMYAASRETQPDHRQASAQNAVSRKRD